MTRLPLVSVIIPSFNRATLIPETLRSVLDQTYRNWECIVVDDGSTDGSQEIIKSFAVKDDRIQFVSRQRDPKGAPTCRNIALVDFAKGEYVVFLDSDDVLSPTCLELRVKHFRDNKSEDLLVFKTAYFSINPGDQENQWFHVKDNDHLTSFLTTSAWGTTSPMWKRLKLIELGGFREGLSSWQDWELHVRVIALGLRVTVVDIEDNYVRRGNTDNINLKANNEAHLTSRLHMLTNIIALLKQQACINEQRRQLLVGLVVAILSHTDAPETQQQATNVLADLSVSETEMRFVTKYLSMRKKIRVLSQRNMASRLLRRLFAIAIPIRYLSHA
ncbi:glycosyltransferase family 2 protein [Neorhodopirellula lusitana]|uniref:glycosyltransferase family 2 protein n=1 Tax=Neorhodopirellula lusitana TaxID=445327 RepID=UPI00384EED66